MKLRGLGCPGGSVPARHLPGLLLDDTVPLEAELPTEPLHARPAVRRLSRRGRVACGMLALVALTAATPTVAQTTPPATTPATPMTEEKPADTAQGPNTGRLSINAGVDWTSAYF